MCDEAGACLLRHHLAHDGPPDVVCIPPAASGENVSTGINRDHVGAGVPAGFRSDFAASKRSLRRIEVFNGLGRFAFV